MVNRQEAIRLGLKRYNGKICEKHPEKLGERRLCDNKCIFCKKEKTSLYRKTEIGKERASQRHKAWYEKNSHIKIKQTTSYKKKRYKEDPEFAMATRVRVRIRDFICGKNKSAKTAQILGCSWEEFKTHIERQFVGGLSWENRDKWHIDHIIPLASAKTEEELLKLCHYSNTQPLWGPDNLRKGVL